MRNSSSASADSWLSLETRAVRSVSAPARYRPHPQRMSTTSPRERTSTSSRGGKPSPRSTPLTQYWSFQVEGSNTRILPHASPKGKGKPLKPMTSMKEQGWVTSGDGAEAARADASEKQKDKSEDKNNDDPVPLIRDVWTQQRASHTLEPDSMKMETVFVQESEQSHCHSEADPTVALLSGALGDTPPIEDDTGPPEPFPNFTDFEEEINERLVAMQAAERDAADIQLPSSAPGSTVFAVVPDVERRHSLGSPEATRPFLFKNFGMRKSDPGL